METKKKLKSSTAYLFNCYIWLLNTIMRGPVSRAAIDEKWARANANAYKQDYLPESNFHRWKSTIEELFEVKIKCNSYRTILHRSRKNNVIFRNDWLAGLVDVVQKRIKLVVLEIQGSRTECFSRQC